ncbi:MAG: hypothetical protein ACXQS8_05285 [Candidatus Helarchaeales archaeon]
MIRGIFVYRPGGICIFHKNFGPMQQDPHAICAFLSAVSIFSETTFGEDLKSIKMANYRLMLFRERMNEQVFNFVYMIDIDDQALDFQKINELVKSQFLQHFSQELVECVENNTILPRLPQFEQNLCHILVRC